MKHKGTAETRAGLGIEPKTTRVAHTAQRHFAMRVLSAPLFIIHCSFFFASCLPSPAYQASKAIPKAAWDYSYKPAFSFDIPDTTERYQVYFLVRHTEAYPYRNMWLWLESKGPADSTAVRARIEVPLANPAGVWLGRGASGIYEHRVLLTPGGRARKFPNAGRYTFRFEQAMRENPLPEVLNVGLRVERAR